MVAEGLVMYLQLEEVRLLLEFMRSDCGEGSQMLMTMLKPEKGPVRFLESVFCRLVASPSRRAFCLGHGA